jgi:hypothetical protein
MIPYFTAEIAEKGQMLWTKSPDAFLLMSADKTVWIWLVSYQVPPTGCFFPIFSVSAAVKTL